jgi:hypothetical protein
MKKDDEKLPGLPGEEVDSSAVTEDTAEEQSEQIDENTVFTREELEELYDEDELEAIIDLQGKDMPEGDFTKEDLILTIIGVPGECGGESDGANESMEVPDTEVEEEPVVTEAEVEEEPVEEVEEVEEVEAEVEAVVEEKKPKARAKSKAKAKAKPKVKKEEEEESPTEVVEEEIVNPVAEMIAEEEEEESKTGKRKVPKAVTAEKKLPKAEVEVGKTPEVKPIKQSALTTIEKPSSTDTGVLEYRPGASLEDLLAGAQKLIDGGLACGHATPEAVLGVVKYGAEIGMNTMTALNNIHMVQGKPTLGVHAIAAQIKKYGVAWEVVYNYEGESDGDVVTTIKFTDLGMLEKYKQELEYCSTTLKGKASDLYMAQVQDALEGKISQEFSYRWSDATQAGLTSKSNWNNHPKTMLFNRCLTLGGRAFKPEALLGLYETMEYAEVKNVEAELEEEGHVVVLTD